MGVEASVIRPLRPKDLPPLLRLLEATAVFRPDELEVAQEVLQAVAERGEASGYFAAVAVESGSPAGLAIYGPTPCTQGTFDLYWIAVDPAAEGRGVASRLLGAAEAGALGQGGRQLVAETSDTEPYRKARRFYEAKGFGLVAKVPDFYRPGDAKHIYVKPLKQPDRAGGE
jgi:ribosomal protein S18 acetylase RimI-like enzyme